ncbi:hypothetical protein HGRIS_000503 [Hohenbuehelia grisea]|uniref:COP9 signalosome complex subunit 3 n=1 Tax=Hohenbuehelia grisea TaxID=104357 RepID=A0ABR3JT88_9AGAR
MTPTEASTALDSLVAQIVASNNYPALEHTIRNGLPKDSRETILASALSSGQDPLTVLDLRAHTLGVLYIISARLQGSSSTLPSLQIVADFCRVFNPDQARIAPQRVTQLAKSVLRISEDLENPKWAVEPLHNLLMRFAPDPSCLTPIHPLFALSCVKTQSFTAALPLLLSHPITSVDTSLTPELTYSDNLMYHYLGGVILAALKKWDAAEDYFETCVSSPAQVPAALQLEALKKLSIIQLISKGKTSSLPKYTNSQLSRLFKQTPYTAFINNYPRNTKQLHNILDKEHPYFLNERMVGLLRQALARAPRWSIKKLTETYLTLNLAEIAKEVNISSENEVRSIVLDMIAVGDINAKLSISGTVTFSDAPSEVAKITKDEVDKMLYDAQVQGELLARLEADLGRSREYLTKAVKAKDDPWAGASNEEELFAMGMSGVGGPSNPSWNDDAMFS